MKDSVNQRRCPLCGEFKVEDYYEDRRRSYLHCVHCDLVYVPAEFHLSPDLEKMEYDLHNNNPDDPGYRKFLSRLANPLIERIKPGQKGLDFGCGTGPTLSVMLEEAGQSVLLYDHYYYRDQSVLSQQYDFITLTEVAEHLSDPQHVFHQLFQMLKPGGLLGIMTKMVTDPESFKKWHYIQDSTHISFYSPKTFEYLSELYKVDIEFLGNDVIILRH